MDCRERNHKWYSSFDEKRMLFIIEDGEGNEKEIPAKYSVCETCNGKGKHVNPSIDSHGLSREDFDNDPDFAEDYFSGAYDIPCNECHGNRVSPEPDYSKLNEKDKKYVEEWITDFYNDQQIQYRERMMGY